MNNIPTSSFQDSKKHYPILDGLRGVAALMVVAFHVFEIHSDGSHAKQIINHGYLAVDFFYLLSGFVIGYAYDDRWGKMTLGGFIKRRLIRLQPMVVIGMLIGGLTFYAQACAYWPSIDLTPVWKLILVTLVGATLIPVPLSLDIRGWHEMHPLNGPGWSLFYEYIANLFYAVWIRKFSNMALAILVTLSAILLVHMALTSPNGDVIGGWSLDWEQIHVGLSRLLFPFFGGLLLSRVVKPRHIKQAFLISSGLIVLMLSIPRIGGTENLWLNGLYDALTIILVFPVIVFIGASGTVSGKYLPKLSQFLGDISYPIYITHYPLIYLYTAWVSSNKYGLDKAWPAGLGLFLASIALAYAYLKWYDEPLRKWLSKRFIK